MKITKKSPLTGKMHTMDLPITQEQLAKWEAGDLVQQVFDDLSDSEREFLISGIPEHEWDEFIGDGEEECDGCDDSLHMTDEDMAYVSAVKNNSNQHMIDGLYEIRFKDIDPDTGLITNDKFLAYTDSVDKADFLRSLIELDYANNAADPNREFYIKNP